MTKQEKMTTVFKILIKVLLLAFGTWGLIITFGSTAVFMNGATGLLYFTVQSNITIMAITLVFLVADIMQAAGGKTFINQGLLTVKFVFTVAITITFLVFFLMLAPTMGWKYLLSMSNLTVHFFVPVLAIADFFLFDYKLRFSKASPLLALAMPLYYVVFALSLSAAGVSFNGDRAPYYFLDYKELGWFSFDKGLGVVYWILLLLAAIIGLCYLMAFLLGLVAKRKEKKNLGETPKSDPQETA